MRRRLTVFVVALMSALAVAAPALASVSDMTGTWPGNQMDGPAIGRLIRSFAVHPLVAYI